MTNLTGAFTLPEIVDRSAKPLKIYLLSKIESPKCRSDEPTQIWLDQGAALDRALAERLVASIHHVSSDAFAQRLQYKIIERVQAGPRPVALFVESEGNHRVRPAVTVTRVESARAAAHRRFLPGGRRCG